MAVPEVLWFLIDDIIKGTIFLETVKYHFHKVDYQEG